MRDEQTGSWWRQATGECVAGSLRGRKLEPLPSEVVSLEVLTREAPDAEVLKPADGSVLLPSDPELPRQGLPAPEAEGPLKALTLVVGVWAGGSVKAFPADAIREDEPLWATAGGREIGIVREGEAIRAFALPDEQPEQLSFAGEGLERLPTRVDTGSPGSVRTRTPKLPSASARPPREFDLRS